MLSFLSRIVEERIREAQQTGAFDDLSGKGKPLELEEAGYVPEELRMAYHMLKNAHLLPPEIELRKEIHTLWDLLKSVEGEGQRGAILKDIEQRAIKLDLLRHRSMPLETVRSYSRKLFGKWYPRLWHKNAPGSPT